MKPHQLPSWAALASAMRFLDPSVPIELMVLKCHMLIEAQMYRVLAYRLDVAEENLPPLQYFQLSKLALCGEEFKDSLVTVLALNDLRNQLGHELEAEKLNIAYKAFASKAGVFWPESDPFGDASNLTELRDVTIRTGAWSCMAAVGGHIVKYVLDRKLYETDDQAAELQAQVTESAELRRKLFKENNRIRQIFESSVQHG